MASPSYVNAGTQSNPTSVTSVTPALPGSRVNGNLLIAVIALRASVTVTCATDGWRKVRQNTSGGASPAMLAFFTRLVDGSESAPVLGLSSAQSPCAQVFQYSGVDPLNPPIGAHSESSGTANPHTSTAITTLTNDSLAVYIDGNRGTSVATPSGWNEDNDANGGPAGIAIGSKTVATAGSSSGAISVNGTASSAWAQDQVEIQSPQTAVTSTFQGKGAQTTNSSATSASPALPSSRSNGDLLVAVCGVRGSSGTTMSTSTTGWTKYDEQLVGSGASALRVAIFTRLVDGSETAPSITWTTGGAVFARIYQYRGNENVNPPFGAVQKNTGTTSPITVSAVTTTRKNSDVIYIFGQRTTSTNMVVLERPVGWREDVNELGIGNTGGCVVGGKGVATSGDSSGAISVVGDTSGSWVIWAIEVQGPNLDKTASDTLLPKEDEGTSDLLGLLALVETLLPKLDEGTSDLSAIMAASDTLLPKLDEGTTDLAVILALSDTLLPKLDEGTLDLLGLVAVTETLLPKLDEGTTDLTGLLALSDALAPKLDEAGADLLAAISGSDSLLPKTDDATGSLMSALDRSDALAPKADEGTTSLAVLLALTDVVLALLGESASVSSSTSAIAKAVSDTILVLGAGHPARRIKLGPGRPVRQPAMQVDDASVAVILARVDALAPKIADASAITYVIGAIADDLDVTADEGAVTILSFLERADTLGLTVDETVAILGLVARGDALALALGELVVIFSMLELADEVKLDNPSLATIDIADFAVAWSEVDSLDPQIAASALIKVIWASLVLGTVDIRAAVAGRLGLMPAVGSDETTIEPALAGDVTGGAAVTGDLAIDPAVSGDVEINEA